MLLYHIFIFSFLILKLCHCVSSTFSLLDNETNSDDQIMLNDISPLQKLDQDSEIDKNLEKIDKTVSSKTKIIETKKVQITDTSTSIEENDNYSSETTITKTHSSSKEKGILKVGGKIASQTKDDTENDEKEEIDNQETIITDIKDDKKQLDDLTTTIILISKTSKSKTRIAPSIIDDINKSNDDLIFKILCLLPLFAAIYSYND